MFKTLAFNYVFVKVNSPIYSTGGSSGGASGDAERAVASVSGQIAANIQAGITTAVVAAQQATMSASVQNASLLQDIKSVLQELTNKTATASGIGQAVQSTNSMFS